MKKNLELGKKSFFKHLGFKNKNIQFIKKRRKE